MPLKIFHTGDIHLGMKYNSYPENVRSLLSESRYLSLEGMVKSANELSCNLFIVAGDLFNTTQISKKDIDRTVNILDKFNGNCVLVMPGNHDYDNGMVDLWVDFNNHHREKILYLGEKKPYDLEDYDLDAIIYPAPCHAKHSDYNNLSWIKEIDNFDSTKYHIGIAHGALEGLSPDLAGEYYSMGKKELEDIPVYIWLLGHTHVSYPVEGNVNGWKVFNAGTPEPDGLNYKSEGAAWVIAIDKDKRVVGERVTTGIYRFFDESFEIRDDDELEKIREWALVGEPSKKIIRLTLKGRVSSNTHKELSNFYSDLEMKLVHLIVDDSKLRIRINKNTIDSEFTHGSFPYVFLNRLIDDDEALQIAYDLIRGE